MKIQSLVIIILALLFPLEAFSEAGREIVLNDVRIVLENEDLNSLDIKIQFAAKSYPIKTEIVENPTRLVFDIEGLILNRGRIEQLESKLIKQARIGVHRDKTRIVFDCRLKDLKAIKESKVDSGFIFSISDTGIENASESKEKDVEPLKANTKDEEVKNSTVEEKKISNKEVEKNEVSAPAAAVTKTEQPSINPPADTSTPEINAEPTITPTKSTEPAEIKASLVPTIEPSVVPTITPEIEKNTKTISDITDPIQIEQPSSNELNDPKTGLGKVDKTDVEPKKLTPAPDLPTLDLNSPTKDESIKDVANKLESQLGVNLDKPVDKAKSSKNDDNKIIIKSIVFQTTTEKMQSSMVISTSSAISYSINQLSKNNYEVVIPSTKLKGEYLKLPQFPPDSFKGFVYFIAKDDETGTRIQIETDDNVKLTPYVAMGKLWIQAE